MDKNLKLNQVIAIGTGEKTRKQKVLTKAYESLKKADLFAGLKKTYHPTDEEGEKLPDETKYLQTSVRKSIEDAMGVCEAMFNIVAAQDEGNCSAKADVVVDGVALLKQAPVTHLLFLEKQLTDLLTFVNSFPTLDPSIEWKWDEDALHYVSDKKETVRTKKVPKVLVKYEATDKHPAQTEVYNEDVQIGKYETVYFSGCISMKDKEAMLERIRNLDKAVKLAREEANSIEVKGADSGTKVLNYIFNKK